MAEKRKVPDEWPVLKSPSTIPVEEKAEFFSFVVFFHTFVTKKNTGFLNLYTDEKGFIISYMDGCDRF
ncbi:MAG: hypothetical protein LBC47_06415, partial [Tannerella sp.]|nr:hypothetical protein [Tannerella sp.]